MTQTAQANSSPSHLYHYNSSSDTEMSSDIGTPATLPVQPSSEPSSPVLLGPPALELVTDRPFSHYQYSGATHCGECRCPKKYGHIAWQCGLVDGYMCQCSQSPSPPDNTPVEIPATPTTPHCTLHYPLPQQRRQCILQCGLRGVQ